MSLESLTRCPGVTRTATAQAFEVSSRVRIGLQVWFWLQRQTPNKTWSKVRDTDHGVVWAWERSRYSVSWGPGSGS